MDRYLKILKKYANEIPYLDGIYKEYETEFRDYGRRSEKERRGYSKADGSFLQDDRFAGG